MKIRQAVIVLLILFTTANLLAKEDGTKKWTNMFNGKDFDGWRAGELADGWTVIDGAIKTAPGVSHLFYEGDFDDFEFVAKVKTTPGSNAGIYFHTKYQESGWPAQGHESQVNQTHTDPVKSGSLYNVIKLYNSPVKDDEWYEHRIVVKGQNIRTYINDKLLFDYTEPNGVTDERRLSHGTIALQSHDPKSVVYFKDLKIRSLE